MCLNPRAMTSQAGICPSACFSSETPAFLKQLALDFACGNVVALTRRPSQICSFFRPGPRRRRRPSWRRASGSTTFEQPIDKQAVTRELHAIKESLVACHKVAERVASHIARVVDDGEKNGLPGDERGSLNPFPQVPDLDADATTFLIGKAGYPAHLAVAVDLLLDSRRLRIRPSSETARKSCRRTIDDDVCQRQRARDSLSV